MYSVSVESLQPRHSSSINNSGFEYQKDAQEVIYEQNRISRAKDSRRKRSWQFFVFFIAAFKYYSISCVMVSSLVYEVVQKDGHKTRNWQLHDTNNTLTFALSLLFFGNLVDNLRGRQKHMIITLEVAFGIINLSQAGIEYYVYKVMDWESKTEKEICVNVILVCNHTRIVLGTGVYLILLLQVFNWFPSRMIHQMMALWTMAQALGFITWILMDTNMEWIKECVVGSIFILIAIFDCFYFRMYPAQENIFVECEIDNRKEKQAFDSMNTRLKMHENDARNSKNFSVYDLHKMSVASSQNELKITYKMPFDETKIYKLIVSGGIRIAASQLSIMSSFLFTNLNQSEIH